MKNLVRDILETRIAIATLNPLPDAKSPSGRFLLVWSSICNTKADGLVPFLKFVSVVAAVSMAWVGYLENHRMQPGAVTGLIGGFSVLFALAAGFTYGVRKAIARTLSAVGGMLEARAKKSAGVPAVRGGIAGARFARS